MDCLANSTQQVKELTQMTSKALAVGDAATAEALIKQITAVVEQERKVLASKAQRSAIVSALKELGYEVREGMETVAPHDGKVIWRRAANTEMGVEVGGIHGGGRVQFRPVRFGPAKHSVWLHREPWRKNGANYHLVFGRSFRILTMMQSYASAAKPACAI
jgi:hypothetical protein